MNRLFCHINAILLLAVPFLLFGCGSGSSNNDERPSISVSIYPVKNVIDRLTDDYFKVNVMIPKDIGHSDYSPTAQQMKALTTSSAYLAIGPLDFELTWRDRLTSASPSMRWVDLSSGINLIDGHHCGHDDEAEHHNHEAVSYDPHYWMSPATAAIMVDGIGKELIAIEPKLKDVVGRNISVLKEELALLDGELKSVYAADTTLTFMIYHPALGYLARDYGFTQIEIEEDGKAPTPASLKRQIESARQKNVKLLFIQKNFNMNNAKVAASEIGASVVQINPESEQWIEEIREIIKHLKEKR